MYVFAGYHFAKEGRVACTHDALLCACSSALSVCPTRQENSRSRTGRGSMRFLGAFSVVMLPEVAKLAWIHMSSSAQCSEWQGIMKSVIDRL
jgi:hypothetical protein